MNSLKVRSFSLQAPIVVRVHPLIIFTVADAFVRRNEGSERVLGTLLGNLTEGNIVDVTDCYVNKSYDKMDRSGLSIATTSIDTEYHRQMLELRSKSSTKECVVGWFASGNSLNAGTAYAHEFFSSKDSQFCPQSPMTSPIHLLIDTQVKDDILSIKAHVSIPIPTLGDSDSIIQFQEVPVQVITDGIDLTPGRSSISKGLNDPFLAGLKNISELIKKSEEYVDSVLAGTIPEDSKMGRYMSSILCSEQYFDSAAFEQFCSGQLQDHLMVLYLSNVVKTLAAATDRMQTSSLLGAEN
eukprot:GHVL01025909.1.p1 GENE.GHVL01025909.1~~GHVL01025909.1.p1  ORF type:complete len:297 (-),score=35.96 GHVL01025909.1:34-924(-)